MEECDVSKRKKYLSINYFYMTGAKCKGDYCLKMNEVLSWQMVYDKLFQV